VTTEAARVIGSWPLDRPFPALLRVRDMYDVFGISRAQFHRLDKLHAWDRFLTKPIEGLGRRFSGALVRRYVEGGELERSRYFSSARRRHERNRRASDPAA
jgi:hypothetical protein